MAGSIATPVSQQSWNLSKEANWNSFTDNGNVQNRTHNATHEINTLGGSNLVHDANGNLTDDGTFLYTYDIENRITQVNKKSDNSLVANYSYDALNRRTKKIVSGVEERYYYDGWQNIEERNNLSQVIATAIYGSYLDESIERDSAGTKTYFTQDERFSVTSTTNATGNIQETVEYTPYGKAIYHTGKGADGLWFTTDDTTANISAQGIPYSYTGQRLDSETGNYYFKSSTAIP